MILGSVLFSVLAKRTLGISNITKMAYQSGSHSVVYVTAPYPEGDKDVGKELARNIIKNKLAACVNIVPQITSIYEWEGSINEDKEVLLIIKTRTSLTDKLTEFVRVNHPYKVAEVISFPIAGGNPPYLSWINEVVPEKTCSDPKKS